MVIDEMSKLNTSYTNVSFCSKIVVKDNKGINAVFFWDTLVLEDKWYASIGSAISCIAFPATMNISSAISMETKRSDSFLSECNRSYEYLSSYDLLQ